METNYAKVLLSQYKVSWGIMVSDYLLYSLIHRSRRSIINHRWHSVPCQWPLCLPVHREARFLGDPVERFIGSILLGARRTTS
jgi:hypothetical protein